MLSVREEEAKERDDCNVVCRGISGCARVEMKEEGGRGESGVGKGQDRIGTGGGEVIKI